MNDMEFGFNYDLEHWFLEGPLTVGSLSSGGDIGIAADVAMRNSGGQLQLNPDADFGVGVYTPHDLRVDGDLYLGSTSVYLKDLTDDYLRVVTPGGTVDIGVHSGLAHFDTDTSKFKFNKGMAVDGAITRYGEGAFLHYKSGANLSGEITVSAVPPSSPSIGDLWFDLS